MQPDLAAWQRTVDLASELADVDEPGAWWALDPPERDRYLQLARVAERFMLDEFESLFEPDDEEAA